jgi:hypothetical protein
MSSQWRRTIAKEGRALAAEPGRALLRIRQERDFLMNRCMAIVAGAVVLVASAGSAWAAPIGPDSNGYYAGAVDYSWSDIAAPGAGQGTSILANQGDNAVSVPIGFNFNFYGTAYGTLYASSNGLITFGASEPTWVNINLNEYYPTRPSLAALWDDWDAANTSAWHKTEGSAGSRRFILQWEAFTHWPVPDGASGSVTFEAILYEDSGDMLLQYKDVDASNPAYNGGASATVGIAEGPGLDGYLQWSYNSGALNSGEAILFSKYPSHIPEPTSLVVLALAAFGSLARLRGRRA